MDYKTLQALQPEEYLNWETFKTPYDNLPEKGYAEKQYQLGLAIGKEHLIEGGVVHICANGTWGAAKKSSHTISCAGIGYHSCTADFWRGVLDSGVAIIVYRYNLSGGKRIK